MKREISIELVIDTMCSTLEIKNEIKSMEIKSVAVPQD